MSDAAAPDFPVQVAIGVVGVLVVATLTVKALKARIARGRPHDALDNVDARIATWWLIAALFGAAASQGSVGLALLFGAASLQALNEFLPRARPRPPLPWCALIALVVVQYALAVAGPPMAFMLLAPAFAFLAFSVRMKPASTAEPWIEVPAASLLCVYGVAHIPALATLVIRDAAHMPAAPAIFLVIVTQASDVLQYLFGKWLGRRPLAPRLSPGKTVEGAVGGLAGAAVLGALLAPLTPYGTLGAAATGSLLCALGIAGGLVLSAQKRRRGIKDWGSMLPGHGGVLDRLDSLCLSALCFYHLLTAFPGR